MISPISADAFTYYKFKLEGSFYDKNGKLINKIKLIPKRKNDRVFNGFLYIVEDDWALYGADVSVTGAQVNIPIVDALHLKQNYNYSVENDAWVLISQSIDFKVDAFGFKFDGRFSAAYSAYNFSPKFDENTFSNEVLSFEQNATIKDTVTVKLRKKKLDSLTLKPSSSGIIHFRDTFFLSTNNPIFKIDTSKISIFTKDTINVSFESIIDEKENKLSIIFDKKPIELYNISFLPEAISDVYDFKNDSLKYRIRTNEIEDYVSQHPDVRECGVIGVNDSNRGESIRLFIVKEKKSLREIEVIDFCRKGLAIYKIPKKVIFIDEIPKNNVGKILRRKLREI